MTELESIRNRFNAIIPGPWRWYGNTATDQVFLGTMDRGRLIILDIAVRPEQYVWDTDEMQTYPLERAREQAPQLWCPKHSDLEPDDNHLRCVCPHLQAWLEGEIDCLESTRSLWATFPFDVPERLGRRLERGVASHPDLRFVTDERHLDKAQHGGRLRSYRQCGPKYEVLGYRSVAEWEMDQGGVVPNASGDIRDFLYREDFTGFDNPEATFIERAPEDIGYLLGEIARLRAIALDAARRFHNARAHSQPFAECPSDICQEAQR